MKRTISALLLSGITIFSAAKSRPAAGDVKLAAFYAQNQVVEIEIFASQWNSLKNQDPKGGWCVFGFTGEQYDWFHFEEVRINGVSFHDAGAKKKSWCGSESKIKPSLNIKLDKFNDAQGKIARDAIGVSTLQLNNSIQDPAYVRQCLSYQMWAGADVASPLCNFAHIRVNNADMGVYINLQPWNKTFLQSNYGEELGNLYEIAGEDFEDWAHERLSASLESMKREEDRSLKDIDGVIDAVSDNAGSIDKIERVVDLDEFFRYWAMEIILSHFDGFNLSNNNAYVYFPPNGKMQVLPKGTDQVLLRTNARETRQIYNENRLSLKLLENDAMRQRLLRTVNDQMRQFWNEKSLQAEVDRAANAIKRFIPYWEKVGFADAIMGLKHNIRARREEIASLNFGAFGDMFDVRLQNLQGKQFCLNAQNSGGIKVANLSSCGHSPEQRWDVARIESDYVRLRNPGSNHCVDMEGAEDAPVGVHTCDQHSEQAWKIIFNRGAYLFESRKTPGKCLSLGQEAESGETVIKKCDPNDSTQNWRHY